MFAYISGSPFVLQDIYGASPQLFSVMFAANALGIVAASQANRALLRRLEPRAMLRGALGVQAGGGGGAARGRRRGRRRVGRSSCCCSSSSRASGVVFPNATALALADHPRVAGSASGLLGVLQFIVGAAAAPLVGVGGTGTAVPMAATIAALGVGGLAVATLVAADRRRHRGRCGWRGSAAPRGLWLAVAAIVPAPCAGARWRTPAGEPRRRGRGTSPVTSSA